MTPREKRDENLKEKLVETVQKGGKVIVVGWKQSNHNHLTQRLAEAKIVLFSKQAPATVHERDFYLLSHFIPHAAQARIESRTERLVRQVLGLGQIKELLRSLEQFLPKPVPASEVQVRRERVSAEETPAESVVPYTEESAVSSERAFAADFMADVGGNPERTLTKYVVAALVRKHFGEEMLPRHILELLEPIVKPGGKKVGSYKASTRLLDLATEVDAEPEDPLERARWLIKQKSKHVAVRDKLKRELQAAEAFLERIANAERLVAELKKV